MAAVKTLDLFSGIGGLTLATEHVADTVGYVEINFYSQKVLEARMADGRLPRAPIYPDIRDIAQAPRDVEMLVGGFPCQDISCIGLQSGIKDGTRSGLFYEIMRLCDDSKGIKVLFLENVANILRHGGALVIRELVARGFDVRWTIKSAEDMGAPHLRKRWFCLATRGGFDVRRLCASASAIAIANVSHVSHVNNWTRAPPYKRAVAKSDAVAFDYAWPSRISALGNSVVPAVARAAFDELVRGLIDRPSIRDMRVPLRRAPFDPALPRDGMVRDGAFFPTPKGSKGKAIAKGSGSGKCMCTMHVRVDDDGDAIIVRTRLPTPRHGNVRATRHPSLRTMSDLGSVLVHSEETKRELQLTTLESLFDTHVPNPRFVEWMMGYAEDWTRVVPS